MGLSCRFVGSVIRNRRMVKAYSILVWIGFFSSLALTVFAFYLVFSKSTLIECYDGNNNEVPCSSIFTTGRKVGFVISNVIGLLFHLCKSIPHTALSREFILLPDVCVVIRRYVEQLEDEQAYKNDFGLNKKNTSYYPFQSIESGRSLLDSKQ